jgi:hypothetical protein
MNNGHFWTQEKDKALTEAWNQSLLSATQFSIEYAKEIGISNNAVRSRLTSLNLHRETYSEGATPGEEGATYQEGDDFINIVCASRRMMSKEDVITSFKINTDEWAVDRFEVHTSEGYRKDRKVDWHVRDGQVLTGDVEDSGKMLIVPMYHIRVKFIRKVQEIRGRQCVEDLIQAAKAAAPKYPKITHKQTAGELLYEIGIPDLHFGRLTWEEETGENYDIKIARKMVLQVLVELLSYSKLFNVGKILLPIGNDFFNVNNKEGTTSHGTRQQEDTRWQKTYRAGRELAIEMIDTCASVAPVDVLIVPGNHDEERIFALGDALDCWYHGNKRVTVNNKAMKRKYYVYGNNLIGFTHGSEEVRGSLTAIMPVEVPDLWAKTTYREWHTGHKHHKTDTVQRVDENFGIVVRILRSLAPIDAWTFDQGLVGALHAAEGFLWHPEKKLIAQFTAVPDK